MFWWWIVNVGVLVHVNVQGQGFVYEWHLFVFLAFPQARICSADYFPRSFEKCVLTNFLYCVFFPCPGGKGVLCCSESHGFHCVRDWDRPHLCPASLVSMWRVTCSSFALLPNMPTGTAMPGSYPDPGTLLREPKVLSCKIKGFCSRNMKILASCRNGDRMLWFSPHM